MNEPTQIRLNRLFRRMMAMPHIRRSSPPPPTVRQAHEVWLFLIVRNEALRLPYVLKYHLNRGVSRVVVLDNQSSDETMSILRSDPRIHVFSTSQAFQKNKVAWLEWLLRHYGVGYWNLVLDADELFVYPHQEELSIPDFAAYLDGCGSEALHCLFMEMFSRESIGAVQYRPGENLLAVAPWFDADGYVQVPYRSVFGGEAPSYIYMGGTRARMFPEEFGCSKYPFFKYRRNQFLRLGLHTIEGARIATEQGAVLHFKYLQDFQGKAIREAAGNRYWNGSAEYKAYAARLNQGGDFSLWHKKAVHYESESQLRQLGLTRSSPDLDAVALHRAGTSS